MNFSERVYVKPRNPNGNAIEALQDWLWPVHDVALWDGPMRDWLDEHSTKWFTKLKGNAVAVQAGGACGMYPRLLADRFKHVYTIEPMAVNFHCLVNNCQLLNVTKINAALGDKPGMCGINENNDGNMGSHGMFHNHDDTLVEGWIPIITIDSLGLKACDLIALDVECFEHHVLIGAIETIQTFHPVITCELGERPKITAFMEKYGYEVQERSAMDMVYVPKNPK